MPDLTEEIMRAALSRRHLISQLAADMNIATDRSYDKAFEYPITESLTKDVYQKLFDRHPMASKVVTLYPEECWQLEPIVYDDEAPSESTFEKALKDFDLDFDLFSTLYTLDILSGIGHYGALLIGTDDDKPLYEPVDAIKDNKQGNHAVTFIRPFAETHLEIQQTDNEVDSPRYGLPELYQVQFMDLKNNIGKTESVHWTRMIHVVDNAYYGEVYGVPRMRPVINTLFDIRKVLGSAAEMWWLGAFPGLSVEVDEKPGTTVDYEAIKKELNDYTQGLKRYLGLVNARINQLSQTISDPERHVEQYLKQICMYLNCPLRVFQGAESAHLAADQDQKVWNNRVMRRQRTFIKTKILLPVINRLVQLGALPKPKDKINVEFEDLNAVTPERKTEEARAITEALATYISGNLSQIMTVEDYLVRIWDFDDEEVKGIVKKSEDDTLKGIEDEEDAPQPAKKPSPFQKKEPESSAPTDETIPQPPADAQNRKSKHTRRY